MKKLILSALLTTLAVPALALAYQPLGVTIKVSGGGTYDYVTLGENAKATNGFDNAFDTIAPGGSLNATYISAYFDHPEWNTVKRQFRGDIRALAGSQSWQMSIEHTLQSNTPTTIAIEPLLSVLPSEATITMVDSATGTSTDLKLGSYTFNATPGTRVFTVSVVQPNIVTQPVDNQTPSPVDGDVDGDGQTTISDAIQVLRMALHLNTTTGTAIAHGDMDSDGKLTVKDAMKLIRKVIGLN